MNTIIEHRWSLPEVDTVFEFAFAMELGDAPDGHSVAVTCLRPPVEVKHVTLNAARPTAIALHFASGYALRGRMEVIHGGDRRAPSVGVYAKLSYDWSGQPPIQRFEGLIFLSNAPISPT